MDQDEEARINRLLSSVEREEQSLTGRPTGNISRQLFYDSEDEQAPDSGEDDDGNGILQEIGSVNEDGQLDNLGVEEAYYAVDDFEDIDEIPLAIRKEKLIAKRRNGKQAYISKDGNLLWDIGPMVNNRRNVHNIIRIRTNHVDVRAKHCKTAYEVWNLFFTDEMIDEIVQCTNVWIEKKNIDIQEKETANQQTMMK